MAEKKLLYALVARGNVVLAEHRWVTVVTTRKWWRALRLRRVGGKAFGTINRTPCSFATRPPRVSWARQVLLRVTNPATPLALALRSSSTIGGNANLVAMRILDKLPQEDT